MDVVFEDENDDGVLLLLGCLLQPEKREGKRMMMIVQCWSKYVCSSIVVLFLFLICVCPKGILGFQDPQRWVLAEVVWVSDESGVGDLGIRVCCKDLEGFRVRLIMGLG